MVILILEQAYAASASPEAGAMAKLFEHTSTHITHLMMAFLGYLAGRQH
jgi:hypothetical protein